MVDVNYHYCPECGSNLHAMNPNVNSMDYLELKEASKYLYCKKCESQVFSLKDTKFCPKCGKKIEIPGYLHYEGRYCDDLIEGWPESIRQCKECFVTNLDDMGWSERSDEREDAAYDSIYAKIGAIGGGIFGLVGGGILWGILMAFIGFGVGSLLFWILIKGLHKVMGPGFVEVFDDEIDQLNTKFESTEKSYMHDSYSNIEKSGSIISAIFWMTILSFLLGWIPLIGSFIAGYIGGKKAGNVWSAIIAAILPALLLGILIYTIFSNIPIVGALIAGATFTFAIAYNLILLCGAIIGGANT